ncbi:MAG: hypothetical protein AB1938_02025 [Myxococcota bacterium]
MASVLRAMILTALLSLTIAQPEARMVDALAAGRALVGQPYQLGGRLRKPGEGADCEAVIFAVAEKLTGCGWRSFPVDPTKMLATRALGDRVKGLDPVATKDLDLSALRPGDVVLLVAATQNPKEGPIGRLGDHDVWVWHTGVFTGDGRWLVGDHFAGQVVETPLRAYLEEHADSYEGVFILRTSGRKPPVCRHHAPLAPPPPK